MCGSEEVREATGVPLDSPNCSPDSPRARWSELRLQPQLHVHGRPQHLGGLLEGKPTSQSKFLSQGPM